METLKENRKIAKFYGAKALTGSSRQKKWAEEIRASFLSFTDLSDQQKSEFLETANFLQTAKFWINNRELDCEYFTKENLTNEYKALIALRNKHYDTLAKTNTVSSKELAKKEIRQQLTDNKFQLKIDFPNFDPYDQWGVFEK